MKARAKRLPRLWCAMQGLLPLEACLAAQRGELAWPPEPAPAAPSPPLDSLKVPRRGNRIAKGARGQDG
jgi:hypothetical protein